VQAGGGETWCEQIRMFCYPQYRAMMAGQDPSEENGCCSTMCCVRSDIEDLMQCAKDEAAVRQGGVNRQTKWNGSAIYGRAAQLQASDAGS
jgi:hypothetical protein